MKLYIGGVKDNMKCKNCGHDEEHHKSSGGITLCYAMISRVPKKLCNCREMKK